VIARMATGSGRPKAVRYAVLLALLALGAYYAYYYGIRTTDLDVVRLPAPALPPATPANIFVQPDLRQVPVHDAGYADPGHYTIIVYHQETCPDCQRLDRDLERFLKLRKDVAVRKIDLGAHWSAESAMRDYERKIWWTPFVVIYGVDGKQLRADDGGKRRAWSLLRDWLALEFGKEGA
jgi:glutaredoxin